MGGSNANKLKKQPKKTAEQDALEEARQESQDAEARRSARDEAAAAAAIAKESEEDEGAGAGGSSAKQRTGGTSTRSLVDGNAPANPELLQLRVEKRTRERDQALKEAEAALKEAEALKRKIAELEATVLHRACSILSYYFFTKFLILFIFTGHSQARRRQETVLTLCRQCRKEAKIDRY